MNVNNTEASHLSKIPEIMLGFWIVKYSQRTLAKWAVS